MRSKTVLTITAVALFALAASAGAAPVPIVNPGFEQPDTDNWAYVPINMGWAYCGGNWDVFVQDWPAWAPEGDQYGHAPLGVSYPLGGFAQLLDATLQADLTYTLTVQVGNDDYEAGFPGYQVELLAGGTQAPDYEWGGDMYPGEITGGAFLAIDDNSKPPGEGLWTTSTVVYKYDPADAALVGKKLQIRLVTKDAFEHDYGTAFDAVALDAVPEPATMTMLAVMGLGFFARRRKR